MNYFEARVALQALHQRSADELRRLRDEREQGPVWLLEHGLDADERAELIAALQVLTAHGDAAEVVEREGAWLCLLILCVEVGYAYEGTGTDYWPRLHEELGHPIGYAAREGVRRLFEEKAVPMTGVVAPDTPWSRNFGIITWPICHSILPAELRSPLLHAIWACPRPIDGDTPDADVVAPLRRWAARHSDRLMTLLDQEALAAGVVKHMLGRHVPVPVLRSEVLDRISLDLRSDREVLRELARVRQRQAQLRRRPRPTVKRRSAPSTGAPSQPARVAKLLLQVDPNLALFVRCPRLPEALSERAVELVRRHRRGHVRLWGLAKPQPMNNILRGLDVPVRISKLPVQTSPAQLLPELPSALGDEQVMLVLQAVQTRLDLPLVFAAHAGPPGFALQMSDAAVFGGGTWWVLLDRDHVPAMVSAGVRPHPDEVCGLRAFRVEPSHSDARVWLQQAGVRVVPHATVDVISPPCWGRPMDYEDGGLSEDEHAFVRVSGLAGQQLRCEADGETFDLAADSAYRVPPSNVSLRFQLGTLTQALDLHRRQSEASPVVRAWLEGPVLRLEALMSKELTLRIDGDLPFEGMSARLSLRAGSREVVAYCDLPALPTRLGPDAQVWTDLAQQARAEGMERLPKARLRLQVGAVGYESWLLEGEGARVWWEDASGIPAAVSESTSYEHAVLLAAQPLWSSRLASSSAPGLRLPVGSTGAPVLGSGLVTAGGRVVLGEVGPRRPDRLLRTAEEAPAGTLDVARTWLAWASARGVDIVADGVRGRVASGIEAWLVQALCGSAWTELERGLDRAPGASAVESLVIELRRRRVLYDDYADEPMAAAVGGDRLDELAIAVFVRAITGEPSLLQALVGPAEFWLEVDGVDLDPALRRELAAPIEGLEAVVNVAYEQLKDAVEAALGHAVAAYEEPDVSLDVDLVWPVLVAVARAQREALELQGLLNRVIPASSRPTLAGFDYEMDDDDVIDLLVRWEKTHAPGLAAAGPGRVARWGVEGIQALYDLWQRPRRAVGSAAWQQELPRFLGGRLTCRVVRYAVLRRRAALRGRAG